MRTFEPDKPTFAIPGYAVFALIFTVTWLLHLHLLRLPYFWDEAGYYVPAARDLWLKGQLIPSSTLSSGHPPLVMSWLAFWWKFSAYTPAMTRTAMLLLSAFGLLGVYRLAKAVANLPVALAATALTAIYPVWFAQSSLAQLDIAAAAFTLWGLTYYLSDRRWLAVILFAFGGLAKETAIVAPVVLFAWERITPAVAHIRLRGNEIAVPGLPFQKPSWKKSIFLLSSALPLAGWFLFHYFRTGVVFGSPEYFQYNVTATLHPVRIALALVQRFWQAFGYLNLFVLTLAAAMAMLYSPLKREGRERLPIAIPVQAAFILLIAAYIVMLSILGGAVIARYMLPVVPLVIILAVSTLRRRVGWWHWACFAVGATFVLALFTVPPYRISPEDNLTYASYVRLHKQAASVIEQKYPRDRVLTAWPASDELTRPWLGYVGKAVSVVRVDNFSLSQIQLAAQERPQYDLVYLFSTKLEPPHPMFGAPFWERLQQHYFDYHRDVPPALAAKVLGGRIVYQARKDGEWVALIQIDRVENAQNRAAQFRSGPNRKSDYFE